MQARARVLNLALLRAVEQSAALPATHCGRTGRGADHTLLRGLGGRHPAEGGGVGAVGSEGWREERRAH